MERAVATTSNSLPTNWGRGGCGAEDFHHEIAAIAGASTWSASTGPTSGPPRAILPEKVGRRQRSTGLIAATDHGDGEAIDGSARFPRPPPRGPPSSSTARWSKAVETVVIQGAPPGHQPGRRPPLVSLIDELYDTDPRGPHPAVARHIQALRPVAYRHGGYRRVRPGRVEVVSDLGEQPPDRTVRGPGWRSPTEGEGRSTTRGA